MKEIITVILIFILFLIVSFYFQKKMVLVNKKILIIGILIYFVLIELFFEAILKFNRYLKTIKVYFDFGHANLLMVLLYFVCFAGAVGFVINIFIIRGKIKNK